MAGRVVLTSVGSFGDLHPFIATGLALKARGIEAVVAASEDYRAKVEQAGLAFRPASPSVERLTADTGLDLGAMVGRVARSGTSFLVERTIVPYAQQTFEELCEAMKGADLVVASSFAISARMAAERLGLPSVTLLLSPCLFLSAQDPPYLMEAPWLPALRRRFGPGAARAALDLGRARLALRTRPLARLRRGLGLPPANGDEALDLPLQADFVAALYSPVLGPLPPDAPPQAEITGFSFYDSEGGEAPRLEPTLAAFLDEGPAPLVFTLGSWSVHGAGDFYERAAATARRLGRRAVLLVGRDAVGRLGALASREVFVAGYAPHSLVFPRAAAVVHHGGVGTVGQALRAGRPQLVCPVFGDQLDNAERLVRLGVARRLDHRRFGVARAAALLRQLLDDAAVSETAARLGAQVAREDGAAVTADRIAAMLAARG